MNIGQDRNLQAGVHTVERYHDISCGHRVWGHESKCAHMHGHNYRITFYCIGDEQAVDQLGRVIDFSVIKEKLCMWVEEHWDHKFLMYVRDPLCSYLKDVAPQDIVVCTFNPTAEHMAQHLVNVVGPMQLEGTGVRLFSVRVEETRKCSATFTQV